MRLFYGVWTLRAGHLWWALAIFFVKELQTELFCHDVTFNMLLISTTVNQHGFSTALNHWFEQWKSHITTSCYHRYVRFKAKMCNNHQFCFKILGAFVVSGASFVAGSVTGFTCVETFALKDVEEGNEMDLVDVSLIREWLSQIHKMIFFLINKCTWMFSHNGLCWSRHWDRCSWPR